MKATSRYLLLCILLAACATLRAQVDTTHRSIDTSLQPKDSINSRHKLAIFLPLYLDSAFDASNKDRKSVV